MKVKCKIKGEQIDDCKVCIEGEVIYLCQNIQDGCNSNDKLGYEFSWAIRFYSSEAIRGRLDLYGVTDLETVEEEKLDPRMLKEGDIVEVCSRGKWYRKTIVQVWESGWK